MADKRVYKTLERINLPNGRTQIVVVCPFCDAQFTGFVMSMAGNGKKCPGCGALHFYWRSEAHAPKPKKGKT